MTSKFTTTIVRSTVGSVLLIAFTGIASVQSGGGHSGGMGGMGGGMSGFGWWPLIWSLILLSVVLIVGYTVYAHGRTPATERSDTDTALSTLRSRYARGEISEEEFEERRHRLEE
ncbi:SHOCT domain-containing protein [Halostella pelagica]|uniref:SHOCT domain-containing protein n=1 Tax=Halostella pelagica TaxID=2583824 RepID=UPI00107FE7B4|nr:SHOCT domain-containing protein [Halostella pelagica]